MDTIARHNSQLLAAHNIFKLHLLHIKYHPLAVALVAKATDTHRLLLRRTLHTIVDKLPLVAGLHGAQPLARGRIGPVGQFGLLIFNQLLKMLSSFFFALILFQLPLFAQRLLLLVVCIAARVLVQRMAVRVQLQNLFNRIVQKRTIMRDHNNIALKPPDKLLQPRQTLQIQIVGRLVQKDGGWFVDQQPRQAHLGLLPAAEA